MRYNFTSNSIWNTLFFIVDENVRCGSWTSWPSCIRHPWCFSRVVLWCSVTIYIDGSVGNYHQNLVNLYFLVTDNTYNAHYETFYFIESLYTTCLAILFLVFDILLVTLCLVGWPCPARCKWLPSRSNLSKTNRSVPPYPNCWWV